MTVAEIKKVHLRNHFWILFTGNMFSSRKCSQLNLFPYISVYQQLFRPPFFWGLKQWKNALFRPLESLFFIWEMLLKKVTTFSAPSPIQMLHQGVARKGMYPPSVCGVWKGIVPLIATKILDMWQAKYGLRLILG
jgi:hypothetical protein